MQQITSLYLYVVLVFNATNKSIYDQEKKTMATKNFRESLFDWRNLNNWLFMWSEMHVRQIGPIRYTASFTRPNSYHCCVSFAFE